MKRKLVIFILALSTTVSAFNGLASFLAAQPDLAETAPITIAMAGPKIKPTPTPPPPPPPLPEGGSWGG